MPTVDRAEVRSQHPLHLLLLRGHVNKLFDIASTYPALQRMKPRDICLQMYVAAAPITTWTLFRPVDQRCLIRRLRWDTANSPRCPSAEPLIYAADAYVPGDFVTMSLNELAGIALPIFADADSTPMSGPVYGFSRVTAWHRSEFSWCGRLPRELNELDHWFHAFSEEIDAHLPAHTDPVGISTYRPTKTTP